MNDTEDIDEDMRQKKMYERLNRFRPLNPPLENKINVNKENIETVCKSFVSEMEKVWAEEEYRVEESIKQYRDELHKAHNRTKSVYKELFQQMISKVNDDDSTYLIEGILLMFKYPEYASKFGESIRFLIQSINEGKRPILVHDTAQYVYGTKPLYFDFWDE
jgi:translation elongation factor EF-G